MADTFKSYIEHGWVLCEIPAARKGPITKGWQTKEGGITDPARGPALRGAGLCHRWSGTCAIDVDNYEVAESWLAEHGIELGVLLSAADAVMIYSGRPGRAKLLYALAEPMASIKVAPYEREGKTFHALEFRCASAEGLSVQDVLPGTIHPDTGRPYEWRYGDSPVAHWSNLPALPENLETVWRQNLNPGSVERAPEAPKGAELSEIDKLLATQDPDCDYDTWFRIGAAVHHETRGSAEGFEAWNTWSARGSKYKGRADLATHWPTFRADSNNPVTLGSLRAEAAAGPDDFPVEGVAGGDAPASQGEDNRPEAVMQRLVGDKLIYIRQLDLYFDRDDRVLYPSDRAVRNHFCPILPQFEREGKNGRTENFKLDPINWLTSSKGRKREDAWAIAMHPGEGVTFDEHGVRYANAYRPTKALCALNPDVKPLVPKPIETEAFNFLWSRMESRGFQKWLMQFYAYALKHPGVKIRSAPLLVSQTTGTGKSTLMAEIPRLLFGHVEQLTEAEIRRGWNDNLIHAWWATVEEIYAGVSKAERNAFANRVKPWITNNELAINKRGTTAFTMTNRTQFTASSNHEDALQIEDDQERRWGVCSVREEQWDEGVQMAVYRDFLESPRAPGVLKYIFQNVNLTGFSPAGKPPVTSAKTAMVAAGLGNWESILLDRMLNEEAPFNRDIFRLKDIFENVMGLANLSFHMLGSVLKKKPFMCQPITRGMRTEKFWSWRNHAGWAAATETERKLHVESGARPGCRAWDLTIPPLIAAMAPEAQGQKDPQDLPDLIGDV